jgi:hypothetical protein
MLALAARELMWPAVGRDRGSMPTSSSTSFTARPALARAHLPDREAGHDLATLRRGFSDEIGSWKIICICGRSLRTSSSSSEVISCPSKMMLPLVG